MENPSGCSLWWTEDETVSHLAWPRLRARSACWLVAIVWRPRFPTRSGGLRRSHTRICPAPAASDRSPNRRVAPPTPVMGGRVVEDVLIGGGHSQGRGHKQTFFTSCEDKWTTTRSPDRWDLLLIGISYSTRLLLNCIGHNNRPQRPSLPHPSCA